MNHNLRARADQTVATMRRENGDYLQVDSIEVEAWRWDDPPNQDDLILESDDPDVVDNITAMWCVFLHFPGYGRDSVADFDTQAGALRAAIDLADYFDLPEERHEWERYSEEVQNHPYTANVLSSKGWLVIQTETGDVIHFEQTEPPEGIDFGDILRFNVTEWETHHGRPLSEEGMIDILDLGYWYLTDATPTERRYEAPVTEWRQEPA